MDKISIVYIGPKATKRDTITDSRLVFPRHEPVVVASDIAHRLLDFPKVWIKESQFEAHLGEKDEKAKAEEEVRKRAEEAARQKAEEESMIVLVDGKDTDLSKFNSAQLATLVEAQDLAIEPKGAQEKVEAFRLRVRDAFRAEAEA